MPYCPRCRAEFRAGFELCKSCGGVPLVDSLPDTLELSADELETATPVGVSSSTQVGRVLEIEGRRVDLMRVSSIERAHELVDTLVGLGVRCGILPLTGVDFPDGQARVEVRVLAEDHERAERILREAWWSEVEREGTVNGGAEAAVDQCPACGAHVPLNVEECPDCGLVVGLSDEDEDRAAEAD